MVWQKISISGRVQGVGFRPFVMRKASDLQLKGFVRNTATGVEIDCEGSAMQIDLLMRALHFEAPAAAHIDEIKIIEAATEWASGGLSNNSNNAEASDASKNQGFRIVPSETTVFDASPPAALPLDRAPCATCLQ